MMTAQLNLIKIISELPEPQAEEIGRIIDTGYGVHSIAVYENTGGARVNFINVNTKQHMVAYISRDGYSSHQP